MLKLAVYITGHGLGHLTRTLEVCRILTRKHPEVELHLRAPFQPELIRQALGSDPASLAPIRLDLGLVQVDSLRTDLAATIRELDHFFGPKGNRQVEEEAEWLAGAGIHAALMDIPPRAFEACALAGVPAYGMTNFSWDWIWGDLAEENPRFQQFAECAAGSYSNCRRLFRTVMACDLSAFPIIEDVPLVSRNSPLDPGDVRSRLSIPAGKPVVLLSYGGTGLKDITLPPPSLHERYTVVATEPMPDPGADFMYLPNKRVQDAGLRYCDLVKAADIVMTKPGYSTVAECAGNHTALVYTDRGRFAEYPAVRQFIHDYLPHVYLPQQEVIRGNWGSALDALSAMIPFKFKSLRTDGAEVVADRLFEEIQR